MTKPLKFLVAGVVVAACALVAVAAPLAAAPAQRAPAAQARPWMSRASSPDERARLLLAHMTLEEKVELMTGNQGGAPAAYYNAPIPRLGIPELRMADAGAGIAPRGWQLPATGPAATAMPSSIAMTATWDPATVRTYAGVVADEARETGHEMLLGPNFDPVRQPFWGRVAESTGEEPALGSAVVVPYVQVIQGRNVIADLKHYTAYGQETNRGFGQNSIVSLRALREVHTRAYEDAIREADLGSVMCSFNKINGVYACENELALDTILRRQLGFTGFVITDFGAIHSTEPSIRAGTDMETGTRAFYDGPLLAAVQEGRVPEALVDRSALRILRTMFAVGVFDTDYTPSAIPAEEHGAVARDVQTEAITLLRNHDGALPLTAKDSRIALTGADATIASAAGGASRVEPTYEVPLLEGLQQRAAATGATVVYEEGNDPTNAANMLETADMTAVPSSVLTPETGTGTGLTARHYGDTSFGGTPVTRTERQIVYDTGFTGGSPAFLNLYASQVPPVPAAGPNPLGGGQSATWDGFITAPSTGTYRLGLTGWGDARLFLDGQLIVDMTGQDGRRDVRSAPLELVGGERHAIRVEYQETRPLTRLEPGTLLLQWSAPEDAVVPAVQRAANAAAQADAAIVFVRTYETEQRDRVSLKLPQNADQLIRAVARANPRTIVVVASGGPVTMPWLDRVPAVLENYFGGQEEGNALARVLFGDVSPSGHLPVTFPRSESDLPPGVENPWNTIANLDVPFAEDVNIGYRGYLAAGIEPLFPFGFGLSYTRFGYHNLAASPAGGDDVAAVSFDVRNEGARAGTEVAQVYVGELPTSVPTPPKQLAGWARVTLNPGETKRVTVAVSRRSVSYFDVNAGGWVAPPGSVPVYVGSSSRDVRLQGTITVP